MTFKKTLKKVKPYAFWSMVLLASGFLLGAVSVAVEPGLSRQMYMELAEFFSGLVNRSSWEIALFIFFNNTIKALSAVVFGVLFAVVPVAFLVINGYILGVVITLIANTQGWWVLIGGLIPHGIFEIPALLLSAGLGMMLGFHLIARITGKTDRSIITEILESGRFFAALIVPLFLLSALIEVYITPLVLAVFSF